jgi:hypothetical protein
MIYFLHGNYPDGIPTADPRQTPTCLQIHRLPCTGRGVRGVGGEFGFLGAAGRVRGQPPLPLAPRWVPVRTHLCLDPTTCLASQCGLPLTRRLQGQLIDPRSGIHKQSKARMPPPQPNDQPARTLQHPPRQSDQMIPNRLHPL